MGAPQGAVVVGVTDGPTPAARCRGLRPRPTAGKRHYTCCTRPRPAWVRAQHEAVSSGGCGPAPIG